MVMRDTPRKNLLLAALPATDYKRVGAKLTPFRMALGAPLYEAGASLKYAYFPTSSVISMVSEMRNGETAEIAVTGNEGLVATPLLMGGSTASNRAVVQCAGGSYRITAAALKVELDRSGALRNLTLHYLQALITQMAQTVLCNRHHPVAQQLCRWLLLSLDRLPSNVVLMTDGLVANMLGVRQRGVTTAADRLQTEGIIRYRHGRITVLDRPKMERRVCACYRIVRNEELRTLPQSIGSET
ncbi:MAG: Crp/Fnr family transcriptional regulator [Casimicrobiaceae bacterium]